MSDEDEPSRNYTVVTPFEDAEKRREWEAAQRAAAADIARLERLRSLGG